MPDDAVRLLVVILGPTASGKTALSLTLAERFDGEIVSCDSVALYRGLEIGTAKPSVSQRGRVPHHLLDIAEPSEHLSAGEYARRARAVLEDIKTRGRLPIVVGGTGLYLRALLEGLFAGPERSEHLRQRLRQIADQKGSAHLHAILRRRDPAGANAIHPNDTPKLIRAIEVCLAAGQPMSQLWRGGRKRLTGFHILRIGLNAHREELYDRINLRARQMFEQGLVQETERLLASYGGDIWPLRSLGYKQAAELIAGRLTYEEAIQAAQQGHRNYAKRQMTWFRREPQVHWLSGFGDDPEIQAQAIELVRAQIHQYAS